jgi:formate dehydrogenase maturation protein FdhE
VRGLTASVIGMASSLGDAGDRPPSRTWSARIQRAECLRSDHHSAASLLDFYTRLLREQRRVYDACATRRLAGPFERDVPAIVEEGAALLQMVGIHGPAGLAVEACRLLEDTRSARERTLLDYWDARSDQAFFAKALLQPYAEWLAQLDAPRIGARVPTAVIGCPRCGGNPQASILEAGAAASADGSSRRLLCATCLTTWPFQRIKCPSCGEQDERRLGYFHSPALEHVRVEACENCFRYLKAIDLGRLGLADPLVDEVAAAPLDVWAQEHGYRKIELNLVGL